MWRNQPSSDYVTHRSMHCKIHDLCKIHSYSDNVNKRLTLLT